MSAWTLTGAAAEILADLAERGGSSSILLSRPAETRHANICIEPAGTVMEAVVLLGPTPNSITLQTGDSANVQHLTDFVEAIANGTLDTALDPLGLAPLAQAFNDAPVAPLLPCWKCQGEAIGFDYCTPGPGTHFLHGAKCRHGDCQRIMDCQSVADATDRWNAIQAGAAGDHVEEALDMVNHPPHYNGHPSGIECIEVTEHLPFNLGNAFKYVFRHRAKNGREDLEKARWYLARELGREHARNYAPSDQDLSVETVENNARLAYRIAAHEPFPLGSALVAIATGDALEALQWVEHLLTA